MTRSNVFSFADVNCECFFFACRLGDLKDQAASQLYLAMENEKMLDLKLDIYAPNILIPENLAKRSCPMLILELGKILVQSKHSQAQIQKRLAELKESGSSSDGLSVGSSSASDLTLGELEQSASAAEATPPGEETTNKEDLFYDRFELSLHSLKALITTTDADYNAILGVADSGMLFSLSHVSCTLSLSCILLSCLHLSSLHISCLPLSSSFLHISLYFLPLSLSLSLPCLVCVAHSNKLISFSFLVLACFALVDVSHSTPISLVRVCLSLCAEVPKDMRVLEKFDVNFDLFVRRLSLALWCCFRWSLWLFRVPHSCVLVPLLVL
jgi:VPS13, central RBG modules